MEGWGKLEGKEQGWKRTSEEEDVVVWKQASKRQLIKASLDVFGPSRAVFRTDSRPNFSWKDAI